MINKLSSIVYFNLKLMFPEISGDIVLDATIYIYIIEYKLRVKPALEDEILFLCSIL